MVDAALVAERVAYIRQVALESSGHDVDIIAVTKTFGCDAITAAARAGCQGIGENYAQEVLEKASQGCLDLPVHFIGGLQSNKVKMLAPHVALWQSLDRVSLVPHVARHSPGARVLVQVNTTGEASKSGADPADVGTVVDEAARAGLDVLGFMTMGPTDGDRVGTIRAFRLLRSIADDFGAGVCSMGMSGDYREALECGSTMLRIGSALFGARD